MSAEPDDFEDDGRADCELCGDQGLWRNMDGKVVPCVCPAADGILTPKARANLFRERPDE